MTFLLHQGNLPQYTATTLAPVCHQFIVNLKFNLKQSQSNNVTIKPIQKIHSYYYRITHC